MPNPWELPLPLIADTDDTRLFEWLGRAINEWERVEFSLSTLYSFFVGDTTLGSVRGYGEGRIYRERADILKRAAEKWFVQNSHQEFEGEFDRLMTAVTGFSDRRNEFAHGIVVEVSRFTFWRGRLPLASPSSRWFLIIPPVQVARKQDDNGMPAYGFSSYELLILTERLGDMLVELHDFNSRLWPDDWPPDATRKALGIPSRET